MRKLPVPSRPTHAGFTLVELLVVMVIIALLVSLVFPVTQSLVAHSQSVVCSNNLRQIWGGVNAAATDNDNKYPAIKINPGDATAEDGAKELLATLQPYGLTEKSLQCAADLKGPNWFKKVNTSYMWQPPAEDESLGNVRIVTPRRTFTAKPSRVALVTDYEAVHEADKVATRKRMNVIYVDGHVASR